MFHISTCTCRGLIRTSCISLSMQSLLECCIVRGVKLTLNRSSKNSFDQIEFPIAGSQSPRLHPLLQVRRNSSKQSRAFVTVECRNWRLFCCVFYRLQSAISLNFGRTYTVSCFVAIGHIYEVCMNPTLNGSWAIQHFKCSNAIEIYQGIISEFYMEVSHLCWVVLYYRCLQTVC